ncbi:MAG: hypothetical protein OES13_00305 [Acidimicrobiia bacterium]|nr:hypothetical protein [Acidimicrobiia bacterium]
MRVHHVKKARLAQGPCEACERPISAGVGYKWIKARYGPKKARHEACATWRPSEMTGSDKLSRLYAARENVEDAMNEWDGDLESLRSVVDDAASEASEVAEEYREAGELMSAMESEMEEKADECESWGEGLGEALDTHEDGPSDGLPETVEEWRDAVIDDLQNALDELSL